MAGRKSQELLLFRPALTLDMKSNPEQEPTVDVYDAADGELGVVILTITAQDLADTQLAPRRAGVHGVYNRSHLLGQRRELMSASSDYLDGLRTGNVVAIKSAAA